MKKLLSIALILVLALSAAALAETPTYQETVVSIDAGDHQIPATICVPTEGENFPAVVMLHGTASNRDEAGGGYQIAAVDAALGRIEDAFAARERDRAIASVGAETWVAQAREEAQVILDRMSRPRGERFDRVGALAYGYAREEVDIVTDRLTRYFESGEALTVEQVRAAAFRSTRGGYREEQVDALLDAVVDVMHAGR